MTGFVDESAPISAPSIIGPPSLVDLAAKTLRRMIIGGQLPGGQRIVENRLTRELGISRPPLREALRMLEREGLVRQEPRKGASVTALTLHDIYEIVTLRRELTQLAVRLGVPVRDRQRLRRCRHVLLDLAAAADADDREAFLESVVEFHVAIVGLSGNRRLEEAYRSLQLQLMLGLAATGASPGRDELLADFRRHERLLEVVDGGEIATVFEELARHDELDLLDGIESRVDGHTEVALRWLRRERESGRTCDRRTSVHPDH